MLIQDQNSELLSSLDKIQHDLEGQLNKSKGVSSLHFDNRNGSGNIQFKTFENGWTLINFDILVEKELIIDLGSSSLDAIHFIFCSEGNCSLITKDSGELKKLNEFQSVITQTYDGTSRGISLKPSVKNVLNIISIDTTAYPKAGADNPTLPIIRLPKLLDSLDLKNKHLHLGGYNVKIAAYVKELMISNESDDFTALMHFAGLSHLILACHLQQLYLDSNKPVNTSSLTGTDLKKVDHLCEEILANPQGQYTVPSLCILSGLSPAKLQEVCKLINNRTVSDYIRHVRLQKAEELIKSSDLNISEVVYSIGFTSRSYFCKIFKAEYGCSPKTYRKKVRVMNN